MPTSIKLSVNQKGLAPILIVILISVVLGGYLLYSQQTKSTPPQQTTQPSPTPVTAPVSTSSATNPAPNSTEETANWKTYTSKNYTFKYPNTWTVKNYINSDDKGITLYILSPDYSADPNYEDPHEGGNIVGVKRGSRLEITTEINPVLKTYEDEKKFHETTATKNWYGREFNKKEVAGTP